MKLISIQHFACACVLVLTLSNCKKQEDRVVISGEKASTLAANQTNLTLAVSDSVKQAVTISWNTVGYTANGPLPSGFINYILQFDKVADSFKHPVNVTGLSGTQIQYKVSDFNALAVSAGLQPNKPGQLAVRLKSSLSNNETLLSNAVLMTVFPYHVVSDTLHLISYASGWSFAKAAILIAAAHDKNYEGYLNITDPAFKFKLTDIADTSYDVFGDAAANGASGNITNPGNPFTLSGGAAYYLIKASLNTNTLTATPVNWGVLGDATPLGWTVPSGQDFTYDPVANIWTLASIALKSSGAFKFRANHDWGLNFGLNTAGSALVYNGANLTVGQDGNYKITLDLSKPGNYTYTATKL